jgi:hypothetical protein
MELFLFWFFFAIVVAVIATNRGRSGFGWFLLSVFISPLLSVILVLALKNLKDEENSPNSNTHVKCPDCKELVFKEASVCKHCGCKLIPQ